jgi:hypothetical protein
VEHHAKPKKFDDLSPFERLREFARRIVAVPKAEIDHQEAEYQRQRAERKQKGLRAPKGAR